MAIVKYYLKRPKSESSAIILIFRYEGSQQKFYTGLSLKSQDWNTSKFRAKNTSGRSDLAAVNRTLDSLEADVKAIYWKLLERNEDSIDDKQLGNLINERLNRSKPKEETFFTFGREVVERKKSMGMAYKSVQSTLNLLEGYNPKLDFKHFDLNFYDKFLNYITSKNFTKNYIGKHITNIKALLNEATEKGLNKNMAFKSSKFKSFKEEVYNIYLTTEELKKIQEFDFSHNKKLDRVRDLFLVGCYTGLRYSDFSQIHKSNIRDGKFLVKDTKKTGTRVIIPLAEVVKQILIKYDWRLPKLSGQKMNDYLKEIGKQVGIDDTIVKTRTEGGEKVTTEFKKYELMTTHTARRSMATNMYKAQIPIPSIMKITGHSTVKQFLSYIKVSEQEVADSLAEHEFFKG